MLGNSIRGIGPHQRALAYQACILPILTYGSALWYAPLGAGVVKHVRRMERVHHFAMSWITGTFCTTPLGARGVIAGIPPLRIILDLRFRGLQARLRTLDDYHIAHSSRSLRWIDPKIRTKKPKLRPRHLPSDNPLDRLATNDIREQFFPFHASARPGDRVQDLFPLRISIDDYSPKKNSSLFKSWIRDLKTSISTLHSSGRPVLYTDGAFWNKTARGAFSFTCYHRGVWQDFYDWCPAGSSFDAEIVAIEAAIQWACSQGFTNPILFVDNKAALSSSLDTRVRCSQLASIRINSILMDRLSSSPSTSFTMRYCPSHSGIEGNERADRLTKLGAAIAPASPPRLLLSNFVNDFTKCMTTHWRTLFASKGFRGRQWLHLRLKKKAFRPALKNKATTTFFHLLAANDISMLSRMARTITNHAPIGEY
ncbi:hypothetical protein AX14_008141 [Amanita brunnescens Koide BX004]|nr:hypothetical protein AX14_008141 [Amanita brunnescens Koide BX004]